VGQGQDRASNSEKRWLRKKKKAAGGGNLGGKGLKNEDKTLSYDDTFTEATTK